jgi:serine/threonine protein kinase
VSLRRNAKDSRAALDESADEIQSFERSHGGCKGPSGAMSNIPDEAEALIGTHIGPYTVVRLLGAGAFGAVFEARKQPLDKRVALKILRREWARDPYTNARFLQEARAAASLRHAHIVDVDDVGTVDGVPWIAMEFLAGESLASFAAREGPLSVARALDYMLPIFSAVAAIHDVRIVHRDLKPENIQLWRATTGGEHPKLLDFGIAKVPASDGSDASLTGTQDVMGTPEYMAPEQWKSAKYVDPATDQWALGVILYRLVAGSSPFQADSAQSMMYRICVDPTPPFTGALSAHAELEAVLRRALEKAPNDRFASVREFAAALLPFASVGAQQRWSPEFNGRPSPTLEGAEQREVAPLESPPSDTLVATAQAVPHARPGRTARRILAVSTIVVALAGLSIVLANRSFSAVSAAPHGSDAGSSQAPVTAVRAPLGTATSGITRATPPSPSEPDASAPMNSTSPASTDAVLPSPVHTEDRPSNGGRSSTQPLSATRWPLASPPSSNRGCLRAIVPPPRTLRSSLFLQAILCWPAPRRARDP